MEAIHLSRFFARRLTKIVLSLCSLALVPGNDDDMEGGAGGKKDEDDLAAAEQGDVFLRKLQACACFLNARGGMGGQSWSHQTMRPNRLHDQRCLMAVFLQHYLVVYTRNILGGKSRKM